jgi:hypothetical protein
LEGRGSFLCHSDGPVRVLSFFQTNYVFISSLHDFNRLEKYEVIELWQQDNHMHHEYKKGFWQIASDNIVKEKEMEMERKRKIQH